MSARRRGCSDVSEYVPKERFPLLSAYDYVLKCSNTFNLLDARGRDQRDRAVGVIGRVRKLAVGVAQAWMEQNFTPQQDEAVEAVAE
jgi:glycyl-tRNA synthetase alpha chain